jgi:SAM-dependent methyltransferase
MPEGTGDDPAAALSTRVMVERCGGSLVGKRVLDVGCLEGGYTATFARLGAREAVGVEIRESNLERCRVLESRLCLPNLRYAQVDAKSLSPGEFGVFDVVFAQGILYHLDDPYNFLYRCSRMASEFVLLDTHVAAAHARSHGCSERLSARTWDGRVYAGREAFEYPEGLGSGELDALSWAAYGNPSSFWLLEESLLAMLSDLGFQHIVKIIVPRGYRCGENCTWECRVMLIAAQQAP